MELALSALPEGTAGVVEGIGRGGELRARLLDLGFTPGARVECLFAAPSGDPRAYLVRGSVIALRGGDAASITVRREAEAWD